jgi:hypothetical protein
MTNISCWLGHKYQPLNDGYGNNRKGVNILCVKCGDHKTSYPKPNSKSIMDMMKGTEEDHDNNAATNLGQAVINPSPHIFGGSTSTSTGRWVNSPSTATPGNDVNITP